MLHANERYEVALTELVRASDSRDWGNVVQSLNAGMTNLRNLLLHRVHEDVESRFGVDSMIAPMSVQEEDRQLTRARIETEIYGSIVAADEIAQEQYIDADFEWCNAWLTKMRLGEELPTRVKLRAEQYKPRDLEKRRLLFSDRLVRSIPEARKAPLITFKLFPAAIRLTVAMAFSGQLAAAKWRNHQISMLNPITDCVECHGRVLENGETCRSCGNPFWKLNWLCATD